MASAYLGLSMAFDYVWLRPIYGFSLFVASPIYGFGLIMASAYLWFQPIYGFSLPVDLPIYGFGLSMALVFAPNLR